MKAFESFIGSLVILLSGFLTIPLVGSWLGVHMTVGQAVAMNLIFFFGRWVLLFGIRCLFDWCAKNRELS